jgi:hypothetical protein
LARAQSPSAVRDWPLNYAIAMGPSEVWSDDGLTNSKVAKVFCI